jgi:VWFA-related protein
MPIRPTALLAASVFLSSLSFAQTSQTAPPEPGPSATVLQAGTQVVVVDVVVQDSNGKPIHGLKPQDFTLTDSNQPQKIAHFEEHSTAAPAAPAPVLGPMPAGTFSNYTPVPPGGTLTVLLLDSLNTAMLDQSFVRGQLTKFVKQAQPGTTIAIFGLTDHLLLLQGFTPDPSVLRDALDHKLVSRASANLPNAGATGEMSFSDAMAASGGGLASNNLAAFNAPMAEYEANTRLEYTLDAFHTLARYLVAFPGRKNVIWFAGSFPHHLWIGQGTEVFTVGNGDEYRETGDLLARAQIAVYPVSAKGLSVDPALNPANNTPLAMSPRSIAREAGRQSTIDVTDHTAMEEIAQDTGGHAFYNTNGIAQAVHEVVDAGSNYYTLMYTPSHRAQKSGFRSLHVELVDAPTDLKLSYRSGYYSAPRAQPQTQPTLTSIGDATAAFAANTEANHGRYDRAAMTHGAPTPEDVLFKVRVLPIATPAETSLAPDNTLDPIAPAKGPFHRYAVDFAMLPTAITLAPQPDGNHAGQVKFTVYVYNRDGKILVAAHRNFNMKFKPDFYAQFIKGVVDTHMEVSVPEGETYLRIGVEDVPSDHIGAVELATADVSRLTPLPVNKRPPTSAHRP